MRTRTDPVVQRRHILDAARQVFANRGYAGSSMVDIAQTANIKRTLLYHYFQDKDEILLQLLLGAVDQVEQLVAWVWRTGGTSTEQIGLLIDGYFELMEAQPGLAELLVDAGAVRKGPSLLEYHARISRLRVTLLEWTHSISASSPGKGHAEEFLLVALGALFIWFLPTPFAEALTSAAPRSAEQYKEVLHQLLAGWTGLR
ncbi:TetR/AcrR family transcriptional regulator [Ferrimicrobium sp.]|uniref:TetR/AcrR family transcriptional regulator n=1 Tax=Ferrimicrobium sp. TaxID=2926050 RepID=UPI002606A4D8|nr:TetR/AcrR family transcriptional regulator [Ferrimicrobium sp.]